MARPAVTFPAAFQSATASEPDSLQGPEREFGWIAIFTVLMVIDFRSGPGKMLITRFRGNSVQVGQERGPKSQAKGSFTISSYGIEREVGRGKTRLVEGRCK